MVARSRGADDPLTGRLAHQVPQLLEGRPSVGLGPGHRAGRESGAGHQGPPRHLQVSTSRIAYLHLI